MERQYRAENQANPEHYRKDGKECIDAMREDFIERFGEEDGITMLVGFCLGNAFKYGWRGGLKLGQSVKLDTDKATWYQQMAFHIRDPELFPDPRDQ